MTQLATQAAAFKALGHPARLRLVLFLADRERCVGDLARDVGLDISTISKHLSILVHAGVLMGNKRGNRVFYRLRTPCVLEVIACWGRMQACVRGTPPSPARSRPSVRWKTT